MRGEVIPALTCTFKSNLARPIRVQALHRRPRELVRVKIGAIPRQ
jgi:hypothetical protein